MLTDVVGKQKGGLLVVALLGAWWTASSGLTAMMASMNKALGVKETRPYWRTKAIGLLLTAGGSILLILAVLGVAVGSELGARLIARAGLGNPMSFVFVLLRVSVIVVAMTTLSGLCYWLLPNAPRRGRFFVPGMIVSTVAWLLVSLAFSAYVAKFAGYSKTYGALGAAIILMTWLYLGGLVLLVGGVINASFDHAFEVGRRMNARRRRWR